MTYSFQLNRLLQRTAINLITMVEKINQCKTLVAITNNCIKFYQFQRVRELLSQYIIDYLVEVIVERL